MLTSIETFYKTILSATLSTHTYTYYQNWVFARKPYVGFQSKSKFNSINAKKYWNKSSDKRKCHITVREKLQ